MSAKHRSHSFELPNGHTVHFDPCPDVSEDAYVLKLMDGKKTLSVTCSCNGASATCDTGTSVSCDCTQNPPVLTCS